MFYHSLRFFLFPLFLLFIGFASYGQQSPLQKRSEKVAKCSKSAIEGSIPSLVQFHKGNGIQEESFLNHVKQLLEMKDRDALSVKSEFTDKRGEKHQKFQQIHKNIPIEGAILTAHFDQQELSSISGVYFEQLDLNNQIQVSANQAAAILEDFLLSKGIQHYKTYKNGELLYAFYSPLELNVESLNLSYHYTIKDLGTNHNYGVYVGANGQGVFRFDPLDCSMDEAGTAKTIYSGWRDIVAESHAGSYRLRENGRGGGIVTLDLQNLFTDYNLAVDFTDDDNQWDDESLMINAGYDLHWGLEATYDYFTNRHDRNSFDNAGATIYGYARYGNNVSNARWDILEEVTLFGHGNGGTTLPLTELVVVAHEFTHGVVQYTGDLMPFGETGALNEAFADIFGIAVDFYARPDSANYLLGEEFSLDGSLGRSAIAPNDHEHPDTYGGLYWENPVFGDDFGGVHINNGVVNHWFYLLCEGGNGTNDHGNAFAVDQIGMSSTMDIIYRTLTTYIHPLSNFESMRDLSIQAAIDLYGDCSNEVEQVTNAWYAVGLGDPYENLIVADFESDAVYSCSVPASIQFQNLSNTNTVEWDFGDGSSSTELAPSHEYTSAGTYSVSLIVEGSGNCSGQMDTIEKTIEITELGRPTQAGCNIIVNDLGDEFKLGITRFEFADIDHSSGIREANEDFTCEAIARVQAGAEYTASIYIDGLISDEIVNIWIDFNDDGNFGHTGTPEYVMGTADNASELVTGTFHIPFQDVVLNTPLRMRVAVGYVGIGDTDPELLFPCTEGLPLTVGQSEDYSIIVEGTDGLSELGEGLTNFELYPNPATDRILLNYELTNAGLVEVEFFDAMGKLIQRIDMGQKKAGSHSSPIELDFATSSGLIFVKISTEGSTYTKSIFKY